MFPFATAGLVNADFYSALSIASMEISTGDPTASLSSLGAAAGDLAVAYTGLGGTPTRGSGGAWNNVNIGGGSNSTVSWCALVADDLAAGITLPRGGALSIYHGASRLALGSSATWGAGDSVVPGFTRSASHVGLFVATRAIGQNGEAPTPTSPGMFGNSHGAGYFGDSSGVNRLQCWDWLSPPNGRYEGQPIDFHASALNSASIAYVFELLTL